MDAKQAVELEEFLKQIVAKVAKVEISIICDESDLREDLDLDSLGATEIMAILEKKYEIEIDEAKALDLVVYKDLVDLVKNYL